MGHYCHGCYFYGFGSGLAVGGGKLVVGGGSFGVIGGVFALVKDFREVMLTSPLNWPTVGVGGGGGSTQ